ncbi:hypothetical protein LPJ74_006502, partial [Coemansia sp. RSA 1843]
MPDICINLKPGRNASSDVSCIVYVPPGSSGSTILLQIKSGDNAIGASKIRTSFSGGDNAATTKFSTDATLYYS